MKKILLLVILMTLCLSLIECKKENVCLECNPNYKESNININGINYSSRIKTTEDSTLPKISLITNNGNNTSYLYNLIKSDLGISLSSEEKIISVALFFNDSVNYSDLNAKTTIGAVLYTKNEGIIKAYTLKRNLGGLNGTDTSFNILPLASGITRFLSLSDLFNISYFFDFKTKELLVISDLNSYSDEVYSSELQHKLETFFSKLVPGGGGGGGGGGYVSQCKEAGGCSQSDIGWCIPQERQNGPVSWICLPKKDLDNCLKNEVLRVLGANYPVDPEIKNDLYYIRDSFLVYSKKGGKYIDNYYYSSSILKNKVTISYALKALEFYNTRFMHKLRLIIENNQADAVLINETDRLEILSLLNETKAISNDTRLINIINSLELTTESYLNKQFWEIRNDFIE